MNINIQKVSEVVIKDANGKVTQRFKLGMASLVKMHDKSQVLELGIAPEERPISKWKHKEGDTVVGVNHRWGMERNVEGTVTQMTESKFLWSSSRAHGKGYGFRSNCYSHQHTFEKAVT